jgi:hypothetical protein
MTTEAEFSRRLAATKRRIEQAQRGDINLPIDAQERELTRKAALHLIRAVHLMGLTLEDIP